MLRGRGQPRLPRRCSGRRHGALRSAGRRPVVVQALFDLVAELALAARPLLLRSVDEAEQLLARLFLLVLGRRFDARELHLFGVDGDAVDLDVVAQEHRLELEHVVEHAQVALELGHDRAAAQVLQVVVNAAALLGDDVGELAAPPGLDLDQLAVLATDHFGHATGDLVGGVGIDVLPQDVDGFVFSGALLRLCCCCHVMMSPCGRWPQGRMPWSKEPPGTMPNGSTREARLRANS